MDVHETPKERLQVNRYIARLLRTTRKAPSAGRKFYSLTTVLTPLNRRERKQQSGGPAERRRRLHGDGDRTGSSE
jgi:hypothetical protein